MKPYNLSFMNIVSENDSIWFLNENWNAIFQMDRNEFKPKFVDFQKSLLGNGRQYKWLIKWKERFVCISNYSEVPFYIIDRFHRCSLVQLPVGKISNYMIRSILQKEKYLYIFTDYKNISLIEFNLETGKFERQLNWEDSNVGKEKVPFCWGKTVYYKGSIWSPVVNTNCITEIDCKTFEIKIHRKREDIQYKWALEIYDNRYYALVNYKEYDCILVGYLSYENIETEIIKISTYAERDLSDLKVEEDIAWLFPGDDGSIIKINLLTKDYTELQYPNDFRWIKDQRYMSGIRFTCIEDREKYLILYPRTGTGILIIDKLSNDVDYFPLTFNMDEIYKSQVQNIEKKNITELSDNLQFLEQIMNRDNILYPENIDKNGIGLNIYRKINEI